MTNAFWLQLPDAGSGWNAGAASALLTVHLVLGVVLFVLAVWMAFPAFRGRDPNWLTAAAAGIIGIHKLIGRSATGTGAAWRARPARSSVCGWWLSRII